MSEIQTIPLSEIPSAVEVGVPWIMADGVRTRKEAIRIGGEFVKLLSDVRKQTVDIERIAESSGLSVNDLGYLAQVCVEENISAGRKFGDYLDVLVSKKDKWPAHPLARIKYFRSVVKGVNSGIALMEARAIDKIYCSKIPSN